MSLADFLPHFAARETAELELSQRRIEVLDELIVAYRAQIEAGRNHGLVGVKTHAAAVMLLAERLRGVHLLWQVFPSGPGNRIEEQSLAGPRPVSVFCKTMIDDAKNENSIDVNGPDAQELNRPYILNILDNKALCLHAMMVSEIEWHEILAARVASGYFTRIRDDNSSNQELE